jgi:OOP family OmpA-OmpF porin
MRPPLLALAGCALLVVSAAKGAEAPGQWYVTPMLSAMYADNGRNADDDFGGHLALGRAFDGWNLEFEGFYYSLDGVNSQDIWGAGVDLMRVWYRERRISPFFAVGGGYHDTDPDSGSQNKNTYSNLAFGLVTDLTSSGSLGLRTEVRWRHDYAGPTQSDLLLNVGLQIPFGKKEAEPVGVLDPDTDGDGVADSRDRCTGTPPGVSVDGYGCPLDSDGDGVADYLDQCPGTPAGTPVDARGCPLDSDGDGVLDVDDQCPGTPAGARVDVRGCEIKAIIKLPDVGFEYNSATLTPSSQATLNDAAATLARNPDLQVEVAGHTDSAGAAGYNQALSERRANSVRDYLISAGADPANLTARGYGEDEPIADNSTSAGRAANRRVELRVRN